MVTIIIFTSPEVYSQQLPIKQENKLNKIIPKTNGVRIIPKTTDSVATNLKDYYNDSIDIEKVRRSNQFYRKLGQKFEKNELTSKIYESVISYNRDTVRPIEDLVRTNEDFFEAYEGKIIRSITISKLDVFGPSIENPSAESITDIGKWANKIHVVTNDKVLKSYFLFKENQPLDALIMSDNERIIRDLPFIRDARLMAIPVKGTQDSVDVVLICQDVWSIGINVGAKNINKYYTSIYDANLLGSGTRFENKAYLLTNQEKLFGYEGKFQHRNILSTFIDADLRYLDTYDDKYRGLKLSKDFLTPEIKYAGKFEISNSFNIRNIKTDDSVYNNVKLDSKTFDLWIGRSFNIRENHQRYSLILGGRVFDYYFNENAYIEEPIYDFSIKTYYLTNLNISKQKYYKSSLVYQYGVTEDIPTGFLWSSTTGWVHQNSNKRYYLGNELSWATFNQYGHYLFLKYAMGLYFKNLKINESIWDFEQEYFSKIYKKMDFRFRYFVKTRYTIANYMDYRTLTINDQNGIRGLQSDYMYGNKRLTANIESMCFTPWYLMNFRFAVTGFVDLGLIGNDSNVFKNDLYKGVGLGILVRNNNLVFETLKARFAWYPGVHEGMKGFSLVFSTSINKNFRNFAAKMPDVINPN